MKINNLFFFIIFISLNSICYADNGFNDWVNSFKKEAHAEGISLKTVNSIMDKAVYLPKVIEYDRYQPEFYEDTKTYINKRVTNSKIKNGISLYKSNLFIDNIEKEFLVEKELLLALMGIETNFGKYLGKMDIISSLATLSYDKRRSEFFTKELIILLKLIDIGTITPSTLYGSWAGAFGNFQFMPRTIKNYAIDYNSNSIIELKELEDSFASAANYLKNIGWKMDNPCFIKINLKKNIPDKLLNTSAKKIHNKNKVSYFKKFINNFDKINVDKDLVAAIITPDWEIVENANNLSPAYLVFNNYELILKWNRSLRFALAVCSLKDKLKHAL